MAAAATKCVYTYLEKLKWKSSSSPFFIIVIACLFYFTFLNDHFEEISTREKNFHIEEFAMGLLLMCAAVRKERMWNFIALSRSAFSLCAFFWAWLSRMNFNRTIKFAALRVNCYEGGEIFLPFIILHSLSTNGR